MVMHRKKLTVAAATASLLILAGCSGGETGAPAGACEPSDGDVTLTYAGWVPGMGDVVDLWNAEHPEIQVDYLDGPSGANGTYQNFFNSVKAGNAADLGQIEYDSLPNFRLQDAVVDLAACEGVLAAKDDFVDWTWNQATFGETDAVYAIPQDTGPMAMYYRADLFEQAGIPVPTTWDEFATAAAAVREQGAYITNFPKGDPAWFAGLVWQNGGQWFSANDDEWTVDLTSDKSIEVADYWQTLIDNDQVSLLPGFSDEWNAANDTGQSWTWISAVWGSTTLANGAPNTSGKWAVAPMPQWTAGGAEAGNWGGSTVAVLKGSKHPYEAAQFALWLNTDPDALALANELGGLYPAATAGADLPAFSGGVEYYGDQKIYDVFSDVSGQVNPDFVWGPTMTQTYTDIVDGFGAAVGGSGTLTDALDAAQSKTIAALETQGIAVKK